MVKLSDWKLTPKRLTTRMALIVLASVALSVIAVSATIYVALSSSTRTDALAQQENNLKTAATILEGSRIPGPQVKWTEDGAIQSFSLLAMPRHRGIAASRHRGIAASRHRGIAASRHRRDWPASCAVKRYG